MIDLSSKASGDLGSDVWFSELYVSAMSARFTGGILVRADADFTIFFRDGKPSLAGGPGFSADFLGEVLVREGARTQADVDAALEEQRRTEGTRALIGALLVAKGADPGDVKRAVQKQTLARAGCMLGLDHGTWHAVPGDNARVRDVCIPVDGWPTLHAMLAAHAADRELKVTSQETLGKSIAFAKKELAFECGLDDVAKRVLRYLEKPRKLDQLERAVEDRRIVRALVRLLVLFDALDRRPAKDAVPIPRATLLKANVQLSGMADFEEGSAAEAPVAQAVASAPAPKPPDPIVPKVDVVSLAREIADMNASSKGKNHFDLLGVGMKATAAEIRNAYTSQAKRFHPDAFPRDLPAHARAMAQDITARLNEAHQTLTNDKQRAAYVAMLEDERSQGDEKKATRIKDAAVKAQMGIVMLRKRDFAKAREFFSVAVSSDPENGEHKANLAWATLADAAVDRAAAIAEAEPLLREALKRCAKNANVQFYMGQLLKAQGKTKDAVHHFEKAVEIDAHHAEAAREVRLLAMRSEKEDAASKKGGLSKLFKT